MRRLGVRPAERTGNLRDVGTKQHGLQTDNRPRTEDRDQAMNLEGIVKAQTATITAKRSPIRGTFPTSPAGSLNSRSRESAGFPFP